MEYNILVVEDDELLASNIQTFLERKGFAAEVSHTAEEALEWVERQTFDAVVTDNALPGMNGHELIKALLARSPRMKVIMVTGYGGVEDAVTAMKEGAFHYLTKPVVLAELYTLLDRALAAGDERQHLAFCHERKPVKSHLHAMIGDSPAMQTVKNVVTQLLEAEKRMATDDLPPVLIVGETGTGKELIARALHYDGQRSKGPFIEFNCASIPAHLIEAELFGHEKGAFTDAKDRRIGLVEAASGGTLFLDEIGEMDLLLQAKLLKLLEDRTVRRVGSVKEIKVDLRIVSATNCNLEQMVQQGKFRRDLFFRLRIISIKMPRLSLRGGDILHLARHFLAQHGSRYGKPELAFSAQAERLLLEYSWPGNVRELRNMLEQVVLMAQAEVISAQELSLCMSSIDDAAPPLPEPTPRSVPMESANDTRATGEVGNDKVREVLGKTDWNVTKSARLLGLSRDMLRYRIEKLGLQRPGK